MAPVESAGMAPLEDGPVRPDDDGPGAGAGNYTHFRYIQYLTRKFVAVASMGQKRKYLTHTVFYIWTTLLNSFATISIQLKFREV